MNGHLGRHVFGAAACASGIATIVWSSGRAAEHAAAAALILGGAAMQWRTAARAGAVILGAVYLALSVELVPAMIATPLIYDPWGNFFEQFTLVIAAAIVYDTVASEATKPSVELIARVLIAICSLSFGIYQAVEPGFTASLVPKWLPPSQMFFTIATTVFFALAALALVLNRMALLATRLLTLMLVLFGIIVWVPRLFASPRSHGNWSEAITTFAIAGAVWVLVDVLALRTTQRASV